MSKLYAQHNLMNNELDVAYGGGGGGGRRSSRRNRRRRINAKRSNAGNNSAVKVNMNANDVCNAGLAVGNLAGVAAWKLKNPALGKVAIGAYAVSTPVCAYAMGSGQRNSLW